MKKLMSFITVLFIGLSTLALTSCDEDDMIGYTLQGTWEGKIYSTCTIDGETYSVSKSLIEFSTDPFTNRYGYGYWVDYYSRAPWDRWSSRIYWEVSNNVIYIDFLEDGGSIAIHDFSLNDNRFKGWFYDSDNVVCDFSLYHTSSPNWNNYDEWGYWGGSWGAKGSSFSLNDSLTRSVESNNKHVRTYHK